MHEALLCVAEGAVEGFDFGGEGLAGEDDVGGAVGGHIDVGDEVWGDVGGDEVLEGVAPGGGHAFAAAGFAVA